MHLFTHTRYSSASDIMAYSASSRLLYFAFSAIAFVCLVDGEKCKTLEGKWYNQLGSEVYLEHDTNGILYGEYRTAVERRNGSAGVDHSIVLGKVLVFWLRGIDVYARVSLCAIFRPGVCFPRRCSKNIFIYFSTRLSWLFTYRLHTIS